MLFRLKFIRLNLFPWVYGASKVQYFPSAHRLPLHMLSQGDPAFGRQQRSTVGGFSDWLIHQALSFRCPASLSLTQWGFLCTWGISIALERRINTLLVVVLQENMHFIMQNSWLPFVAGTISPCLCSSPSRRCAGVGTTEFRPSLCAQKWDRQHRPQSSSVPGNRDRM